MIASYAKFTKRYPIFHFSIVILCIFMFFCSSYLLLVDENIWAILGLITPLPLMFLFANASKYKRKYLHG
ncbi:putative membrane protein [Photobacterium kishitanii]|nr:putative membrane protein [Photobacterium kishitanii]